MFLIKQAQVYAPEYLGVKDVLICGGKIEAIEDHIDDQIPFCQVIDGTGKKLTPGIIDPHVHITGGGGEGSFHTQVPPVKLSELIRCQSFPVQTGIQQVYINTVQCSHESPGCTEKIVLHNPVLRTDFQPIGTRQREGS